MADTPRLGLPLLAAGQAQKHVTVNDALARLDAFGAAAARSRSRDAPPADPPEGALYLVPQGGAAAWGGAEGALGVFLNGGWVFASAEQGRRLWIVDEGREVVFDGTAWVESLGAPVHGAATAARIVCVDHVVAPGAVSETPAVLPDRGMVLAVTAVVLEAIGGAPSWRLGTADDPGRYGSGLGVAAGAVALGVTGQPVTYYGATGLRLESEGAAFTGGRVRLAAHLLEFAPPRAD